jgi:hypothetical protein
MGKRIWISCALFGVLVETSLAKVVTIDRPASLTGDQELNLNEGDAIIFEPSNASSKITLYGSSCIKVEPGCIMVEGIQGGYPAIIVVKITEARDNKIIGVKISNDPKSSTATKSRHAKVFYVCEKFEDKPENYLKMYWNEVCEYVVRCGGKVVEYPFYTLMIKGAAIDRGNDKDGSINPTLENIIKEAHIRLAVPEIGSIDNGKNLGQDAKPSSPRQKPTRP